MSGGLSERFARHAAIPGFHQERLASATVILVGVGALGSVVAEALALVGVGRLVLCDPDVIATSNLSRGPLFRPSDVGQPKVVVAAKRLAEMAPDAEVIARDKPFVRGVGLAEMRDASLVIGCLDSRAARVSLAGRCGLARAKWIDAATAAWSGEVKPFLDPDGPCYACALSPEERAATDAPWSCMDPRSPAPLGASAPVSALVGAFAATLATRALLGLPVVDHAVEIDAAQGLAESLLLTRSPDCPLHRPIEQATKLPIDHRATVGELRALLGPDLRPLVFAPILRRLECPGGDYAKEAWGAPFTRPCPSCGTLMRARTTLELDAAPEGAILSDLGVAPREILPLRGPRAQISYAELA